MLGLDYIVSQTTPAEGESVGVGQTGYLKIHSL